MIPHERTRLTYAEQQALLEMERHLDRPFPERAGRRGWGWQLAGVVLLAAAAFLLGGVVAAPSSDATVVVVEAAFGAAGVVVGAFLAIDPLRYWLRTLPQTLGVDRWRRRRLAQRLDGPDPASSPWWRRTWRSRAGD